MANSNAMARSDADKNHVGASMIVIDSAGDVGKVALSGKAMAWANFDGRSSGITPRAGANVSSITDNGVGDYTVNFAANMPDTSYAILETHEYDITTTSPSSTVFSLLSMAVSGFRFCLHWSGTKYDHELCSVLVVR